MSHEWKPGDYGKRITASLVPHNVWRVVAVDGERLTVNWYWPHETPPMFSTETRYRVASESEPLTVDEVCALGIEVVE